MADNRVRRRVLRSSYGEGSPLDDSRAFSYNDKLARRHLSQDFPRAVGPADFHIGAFSRSQAEVQIDLPADQLVTLREGQGIVKRGPFR